ncbi:IS66 family insertion sequence element accessory protein TnpA [Microbulbifer sp. VAAC004]|uniref:IS66 family insertion sequence element accessory protein TnpA n=1 Tax=unclassified Microbulbifer TaxID=2619833 RepID=UPI00403A529C
MAVYEKSSQSKCANVRNHNLNYSQFLYWYRKLSEQTSVSNIPDFVPVNIKFPTVITGNLGILDSLMA